MELPQQFLFWFPMLLHIFPEDCLFLGLYCVTFILSLLHFLYC
uniref:Uncharacterized protein n=1 Tax=Arundo donax TaxID=35708 RepID=A0A0A9H917_ARUDO